MEHVQYDIRALLERWGEELKQNTLPAWETLPTIGLYMDQVIVLLTQYLEFMAEEESMDKIVTPSIVNNYVRMKVIPAPIKKKYNRIHLAYLIMVCMLKQCLSISLIQKLVPLDQSEEQIQEAYNRFTRRFSQHCTQFVNDTKAYAEMLEREEDGLTLESMLQQTAVVATLSKYLTEKMIELKMAETPAESGGQSKEKGKNKAKNGNEENASGR